MRVLNQKHGDLLQDYINFLLMEAFDMTDDDNSKFKQFNTLIKGIVRQSDEYTKNESILGDKVIHEWLFMTPNLLFHSFNGFCVGIGYFEGVCSEDLMKRTMSVLKSLSKLEIKEEPKFMSYVRD